MKMRKLFITIAAAVAVLGITACDPAPPYEGCVFLAAGDAYRDSGNEFSQPYMSDVVDEILSLGYEVDYDGVTNAWTSTMPGSGILGYSVEEDTHVWSCRV